MKLKRQLIVMEFGWYFKETSWKSDYVCYLKFTAYCLFIVHDNFICRQMVSFVLFFSYSLPRPG